MLVLTRKCGETIMIGDFVEITVIKIWRGQVRLSIKAPLTVPIFRREIYEARRRCARTAVPVP